MRNDLEPTQGKARTRLIASFKIASAEKLGMYVDKLASKGGKIILRDFTTLVTFGGLPKRIDIGKSIGFGISVESRSNKISLSDRVVFLTIEYSHRSLFAIRFSKFKSF
jgi:hypothetical protein